MIPNIFIIMSKEMREQINKFKRILTEGINNIDFIFKQHPELSNIGTEEQYSNYLNTIFPNSKVRNILYHGSNVKDIDKFRPSRGAYGTGVYFQTKHGKYHTDTFGGILYSVLINTKNPYTFHSDFKGTDGKLSKLWTDLRDVHSKNKTLEDLADDFNYQIRKLGYDSLKIQTTDTTYSDQDEFYYVVYSPEQIHILGSKQDMEGFKNFINKSI